MRFISIIFVSLFLNSCGPEYIITDLVIGTSLTLGEKILDNDKSDKNKKEVKFACKLKNGNINYKSKCNSDEIEICSGYPCHRDLETKVASKSKIYTNSSSALDNNESVNYNVACVNIWDKISYREQVCNKGEKKLCSGTSCHHSLKERSYKSAGVISKISKISDSKNKSPQECVGSKRSFTDKLLCGATGSVLWHKRVTIEDKNKYWDSKSINELCREWDSKLEGVDDDAMFGDFFRKQISLSLKRRGEDPLQCSNPSMDKARTAEKNADDALKRALKAEERAIRAERAAQEAYERCWSACSTGTFCDC